MSERQRDIADMQCWVFHMAQSKWKMSPEDCAELFKNMIFLDLFPNVTTFFI